jgi:hypothetical protein
MVKCDMRTGTSTRTNLDAQLATLSLPPTASGQDVKRAFRSLVRQHHPDAVGDVAAGGRQSHDGLTAIVTAYRELGRAGLPSEIPVDGSRRNGRLVDVLA